MARTERSKGGDAPGIRIRPSEAEIAQLLERAKQQYEECMRIGDIPDYSEVPEVSLSSYSWDNPIGLVVTEGKNALLG